MKPDKVEFKVGETIHQAPVKLVYEKDYMGRYSWTIIKLPSNQRDDRVTLSGLTTEILLKMAQATNDV